MRFVRLALFLPALLLLAFSTPSASRALTGRALSGLSAKINDVLSITNGVSSYTAWNLGAYGLSQQAFELAEKGFRVLQERHLLRKTSLLTVVDYSQPSTRKRLYVIDMQRGKLLFHTLVAHGRNSGYNYASSFSNEESSLKSSLGFFITQGTYTGANGYSLKLKGCETGINDHAMERAIVVHGADYVSDDFIRSNGYLGRSYGCPAIPVKVHEQLINKIKNGSCMFLFYPEKTYLAQSKILDK